MLKQILPIRLDPAGNGAYGAPRSKMDGLKRIEYTHRGIDYVCIPGGEVCTPITGVVTRLGWAYKGDMEWRYVEVQDNDGVFHRFFYVEPQVIVGEPVFLRKNDGSCTVLGVAQDITKRYQSSQMLPHIHHEAFRLIDGRREYIEPK